MYIREGETSNTFLSSETYMTVRVKHNDDSLTFSRPVLFSGITRNRFHKTFTLDNHKVSTSLKHFIEKADQSLQPDENGGPHAIFVLAGHNNREEVLVKPGQTFNPGTVAVKFLEQPDSSIHQGQVNVFVNASGACPS